VRFFRIHLRSREKPTSAINSVYRSDRYNFTDATKVASCESASRRDGEAPNRFVPKRISWCVNGARRKPDQCR